MDEPEGGPEFAAAAPQRRNLYGRRHGKKLKPSQRQALDEVLPRLSVPLPPVFPDGFPNGRPLWLEVGFGGGEHLAHQAAAHPEVGLIGCEPYVNGVAMALLRIEAAGLENVRIHPGDARDLIDALPDGSLARVFLLYPDPWPKARHHRRRFASPENLAALRRVMLPGAELRIATDIADYARHALEAVADAPGFEVASAADTPWPGWPGTRYEAKALAAGRRPRYLSVRRL
ncbi:MAG TPA: tRNA (guanine(46)-N(7))-methyltransferase TrmB [Amaricoccus sp.]|nr:tRNA (guanine(46)-N(7))-methyltransferase TrmB [Amaricoccus sp.]